MQAGQFYRTLHRVSAVVDEETACQVTRSDVCNQFSQSRTPRLQQFLAIERHAAHLVSYRLDDARMVNARAEDSVATEAIDVFAPQQVGNGRTMSGPFERRKLPGFGD